MGNYKGDGIVQRKVIVVYSDFELKADGTVYKKEKWEAVDFCEHTMEYDDKISYEHNLEKFVFECGQNPVVYIEDGKYITIGNVHGFYSDAKVIGKNGIKVEEKSFKDNKNKHFKHKRIRHNNNRNATANLPFKVEKSEITSILPSLDQNK